MIFWTLAVEEQFYLTWPFLLWMLSRERMVKLCVGLIVTALVLRIALASYGAGVLTLIVFTPGRMDTLAAGALVALLVRGPEAAVVFGRTRRAIALAVAVGIIAVATVTAGDFVRWAPSVRAFGYSGVAILWAVVVATVVTEPSARLARVLSVRSLQRVGQYSYAMYVFHMMVIIWIAPTFFSTVGTLKVLPPQSSQMPIQLLYHATVIIVTFAIAWVSWHLYEKQFLKLKVFFRRHEKAGTAQRELSSVLPPTLRPDDPRDGP